MKLEPKQREILGKLFMKLTGMSQLGEALVKTGDLEGIITHVDEMHEIVEATQEALEDLCGASAVLARAGERAKTLSGSKVKAVR